MSDWFEGPRTPRGSSPSCAPGTMVVCTETGMQAPYESSNRNANSGIALSRQALPHDVFVNHAAPI
eukprot:scaffold74693_cov42-Phaeocystis_antarctica.AAC.2